MDYPSKSVFAHFARYNGRANAELYEVMSKLTDKARKRSETTWFGSINSLLNHLLVGDMIWLQRFRPVFPESRVLSDPGLSPAGLSWQHDFSGELSDLQRQRMFVDERIIAWFEECPEERYGATFQYTDSAGMLREAVAAKAFQFLFVHQIHHRGQLAQLLDSMGLPNNFADNGPFIESAD